MSVLVLLHYWIGSINNPQIYYRDYFKKFNIISDNIKINRELKNDIPDKSWLLYLLEVFNQQNVAVELNLICQFDNQNYFEAIFSGYNKYRFNNVLPETGNTYLRQIKFNKSHSSIEYYLKNLNSETDELFVLDLSNNPSFSFQFSNFFTGIEWWNKISNRPYPIRLDVEISNLLYGYNDNTEDSESIVFFPVNSLSSNKDGQSISYPVRFTNNETKNGCLCYNIALGSCVNGLDTTLSN